MTRLKIETRNLTVTDMVATDENDVMKVEGYAVKWNTLSKPMQTKHGAFVEEFDKRAFDESLESDAQLVLYGHDQNRILGRTDNATAEFRSDDVGLYLSVTLPNTTLGRDTFEEVRRKDIGGMSVGFSGAVDKFSKTDDGIIKRTITKARLYETSLVTVPAYDSSSVDIAQRDLSSLEQYAQELKQIEQRKLDHIKRLTLLTY